MGRFLALVLACALVHGVQAQEPEEPPNDALDRGTPHSSTRGFLLATGEQDYDTAARFLDQSDLPDNLSAVGGPELARQLDFVLAKAVEIDDYSLDDTATGRQGDDLPQYRDLLTSVPGADGEVRLYMERVPRSDGVLIWKISGHSLAEIPALYAYYANPPWVEYIRTKLPQGRGFLGVELYKWVIALAIGLLARPLAHGLGLLLSRLLARRDNPLFPLVRKVMTRPLTALTLFSQQPIRVGDFCKYQDILGVVEEIGLRTTRIRTLDDTVVCVPNARIAHSEIENYSARDKFHYKPVLRLRYDSTPEQIRNIIEGITGMLTNHSRVLKDIVRVRFTDFTEDAILIKVHCYVNSGNISECLEIAEELNLKIMDVVEGQSASFALPSRMVFATNPAVVAAT